MTSYQRATKKPHVVVVGNGFAGVYSAKHLLPLVKRGVIDVTLIGRNNYFLFTPLLHEVATGSLTPTSIIEPLREIFRDTSVQILQDEVTGVHLHEKYIEISAGRITFDYLVLSTGAGTNFRGVKGAAEYAFSLKTLADAVRLRDHIIDSFEDAELHEHNVTELSFAVVGGGPTGVELAAELEEFVCETLAEYYSWDEAQKTKIRIILLASPAGILAQGSAKLRRKAEKILTSKHIEIRTGDEAVEVQERGVQLKSGEIIPVCATVWAAGVEPLPPTFLHDTPACVKGGRLCVDADLRLQGFPTVFALGDVASFADPDGGKRMPMLAQAAVQEAKVAALNITRLLESKPTKPFMYRSKGFLVSLGAWQAGGDIAGFAITGPFMWWIWRTVYLFKFLSWRKRFKIMAEWTVNLFYPRDISKLS